MKPGDRAKLRELCETRHSCDAGDVADRLAAAIPALCDALDAAEAKRWTCKSCGCEFPSIPHDEDVAECTRCVEAGILQTKLDAAEAVVAKLQKTSDGKPLIPDERYWVVCQDIYADFSDTSVAKEAIYHDRDMLAEGEAWDYTIVGGEAEQYSIDSVWSTESAALAAAGKERT